MGTRKVHWVDMAPLWESEPTKACRRSMFPKSAKAEAKEEETQPEGEEEITLGQAIKDRRNCDGQGNHPWARTPAQNIVSAFIGAIVVDLSEYWLLLVLPLIVLAIIGTCVVGFCLVNEKRDTSLDHATAEALNQMAQDENIEFISQEKTTPQSEKEKVDRPASASEDYSMSVSLADDGSLEEQLSATFPPRNRIKNQTT
uniref:Uncharacterized protein n=1 Tax=Romanomermis culicivorax TaxID=13658 RepID=A0A915HWT3_ROMCU